MLQNARVTAFPFFELLRENQQGEAKLPPIQIRVKMYFYNLSSYQNERNKRVTVIELRNKNEQNVISYSQIKKIENMFCKEISNSCNLLILNKLVRISRR